MGTCSTAPTPLTEGAESTLDYQSSEQKQDSQPFPYRELIGSLMYLVVATRPDIAYAVAYLSQFLNNPQGKHWTYAKRVLRYLKGTKSYSIFYKRLTCRPQIIVFSDASHGLSSWPGYCFSIGSGPISWKSKKLRCSTTSTTETKFYALSLATQQCLFIQNLLIEMDFTKDALKEPIIHVDNQGTINYVETEASLGKLKHINLKFKFVKEKVQLKVVTLQYIETKKNIDDI